MFFAATVLACLTLSPSKCDQYHVPPKLEARACRVPPFKGVMEMDGRSVSVTLRIVCAPGR